MTTTDPTRQLIEHDAGHASPVADCQWCPTTDRRWSEATRELVAETLHADLCPEDPDDGDACMCDIADHDRSAGVALDALAAAGLLADPQELERLRARVAELEQTLDTTRQQILDEAASITRDPAHPPVAADIAWQLRRIAERETEGAARDRQVAAGEADRG